jgi:hypothetical protein
MGGKSTSIANRSRHSGLLRIIKIPRTGAAVNHAETAVTADKARLGIQPNRAFVCGHCGLGVINSRSGPRDFDDTQQA